MMDPWYTQRGVCGWWEQMVGINYRSGAGGSKSSQVAPRYQADKWSYSGSDLGGTTEYNFRP